MLAVRKPFFEKAAPEAQAKMRKEYASVVSKRLRAMCRHVSQALLKARGHNTSWVAIALLGQAGVNPVVVAQVPGSSHATLVVEDGNEEKEEENEEEKEEESEEQEDEEEEEEEDVPEELQLTCSNMSQGSVLQSFSHILV
eukprot:528621-Amphidinium_carterae.1